MDCEKSYSYFNNLIAISGFYKPFQQITDIDIKSYVKYLYIFYSILVGILYFGTHHTSNREAGDSENSFGELIIIKGG